MLLVIAVLLACLLFHVVVRDFQNDWRRESAEILKKHTSGYRPPKTAAQREADRLRDELYLQKVGAGR